MALNLRETMFCQFHNPLPKTKGKSGDDERVGFCLNAEFRTLGTGKEDALFLAVTNGVCAWIALVRDADFENLVNGCRLGSFETFRSHTVNAFNQTKDPAAQFEYLIEAKVIKNGEELEVKWRLRQGGVSQLIGQALLFKSSNSSEINFRFIQSALSSASIWEYQTTQLEKELHELIEAENRWSELRTMPDISQQITERTVEILNEAKRRNRELGGSTEGFAKAWQQATQHTEVE
ncbi:uncharacterized protein LOC129585771 [Paramacrobiotus metropolitanus]|uniref:uncharacterized protein LOC129585771 n=1 Tax=Paramacrobiotus metropolitanus TaxID=2943436 RepID=UPI00244632BE|nr:uncharacterized protein LOC129585771 [Paramacrobiotus metropolitanus]